MRTQILATAGATALAIGALIATAPSTTATVVPAQSDCEFRVEVALTEALEGVYAPDGWEVQEDIMLAACEHLGHDSEATVYEDGSWVVVNPVTNVYWTGCVSTEAPCAAS